MARLGLGTILALVVSSVACSDPPGTLLEEDWPANLSVSGVYPNMVVPGTQLTVTGAGFVGPQIGTTQVRLEGTFNGLGGEAEVRMQTLAEVASNETLIANVDQSRFQALCPGGDGTFNGRVLVEVASVRTNKIHRPAPQAIQLTCRRQLTPRLVTLMGGNASLNQRLTIQGSELLLGNGEGTTLLDVSGCFLVANTAGRCDDVGEVFSGRRLPVVVVDRTARADGEMTVSSSLFGIEAGAFVGSVKLVNVHADGSETLSETLPWSLDLQPSYLADVDFEGASLGGYVDFYGSGFIGGEGDGVTQVALVGTFQSDSGGEPTPLDVILVTDYDSGVRARYVLAEDGPIGSVVNLRKDSGTVEGEFTLRLSQGGQTVSTAPIRGAFRVRPVRQIVYVNFTDNYSDTLSRFGLGLLDAEIRERLLARASEVFAGIGVEYRTTPPMDYALFSQIDVLGIDPNGLGLMGYDNSPGKDVGNVRLYDRIGGVHAVTQQDGFPGYGGIFLESFFGFSNHPPPGIDPHPGRSILFDAIFDPLRPDGGTPVSQAEADAVPETILASDCPGADRAAQVRCGVFVLSNLLGGTMAHEVAHSLGLADPDGGEFHNNGDEPNRLMDSGFNRPFKERAQLFDSGPEIFCRENYQYLRGILPTDMPDPEPNRPVCF